MAQRPDLRAAIIAAVVDFAFSIPDKQHELIYVVAHKLALLLKEWETRTLAASKDDTREVVKLPLTTVCKLEAVALVLLCSPFSNIRLNALDCLSSLAAILGRFADDDDLPAQRVHDIITEAAPDVVQRLHQDYLFRLKVRHRCCLSCVALRKTLVLRHITMRLWHLVPLLILRLRIR